MSLANAFTSWNDIEQLAVLNAEAAHTMYHSNTLAIQRSIAGAVRPTNREQVKRIVEIANREKVVLHAFSTGHDWGFGSSLPTIDGSVIVDLSQMKRVVEFNADLGYVVLEPGVTQQDLYDYMQEHGHDFMVPTTGAGPSCSVMGNALERGYGITPIIDHFAAVMSMEVVLADGSIYRSTFDTFGAKRADPIYKWKVGPYLDGIFSESNFGIVTEITIMLGRKPEKISQFVAFVDDEHLGNALKAITLVKDRFGSMIGGVNLMNDRRVLSMTEAKEVWKIKGVLSENQIAKIIKKRNASDWTILIGIYSPEETLSGIKKHIKKQFPYAKQSIFLNRRRVALASKVLGWLPDFGLRRSIKGIEDALDVLEGKPSEVALPLAYLKNPQKMPDSGRHPDKDGCGLIWYTPVIPIEEKLVRAFAKGVKDIFLEKDLEPLITFTAISHQAFAANIPIVFDRSDEVECAHAWEAFEKMMDLSRELEVFPDRLDIQTIRKLYDHTEGTSIDVTEKIKNALDPNNIFAPGRYSRIRHEQ